MTHDTASNKMRASNGSLAQINLKTLALLQQEKCEGALLSLRLTLHYLQKTRFWQLNKNQHCFCEQSQQESALMHNKQNEIAVTLIMYKIGRAFYQRAACKGDMALKQQEALKLC